MTTWGVRYVIVAVGTPDDPATLEEMERVRETISYSSPFLATILSPGVSDKLTLALLAEQEGVTE